MFSQLSPLTFFSFSFHIKRLADYIILFRKSMIAKTSLDSVTTIWGKNPGISSILDFSSEHLVSLFVKCKDEEMLSKISFSSKNLIIPISETYIPHVYHSLIACIHVLQPVTDSKIIDLKCLPCFKQEKLLENTDIHTKCKWK